MDDVLSAVQVIESAGRPWVIFDNTTRQSLSPTDLAAAQAAARMRLAVGHNLDLGLYQINTIQLQRPGISLESIFDVTVLQELARTILGEFLQRARSLYGDSDLAWERAIGAYNDGRVDCANVSYVARVLAVLGRAPVTPRAAQAGRATEPIAGSDASSWSSALEDPAPARGWPDVTAAALPLLAVVMGVLLIVHGGYFAAARFALGGGVVSVLAARRAAGSLTPWPGA